MAALNREPGTRLAVVGAGWAGISAAVWARAVGLRPMVFEAARQLGGRARAVSMEIGEQRVQVDNGQHLMMGAYTESIALHDLVMQAQSPSEVKPAFERTAFALDAVSGWSMRCGNQPAPWHLALGLLRAKGIPWIERLRMVWQLERLKRRAWQMESGLLVSQWMRGTGQSEWLRRELWGPLCVATLNTPAEQACAQTFAHILRDTLGASSSAIETLFAQPTLSAFIPEPAEHWMRRHDVELRLGAPVRSISPAGTQWQISTADGDTLVDQVILSTPPRQSLRLLQDGPVASSAQWLAEFNMLPIASVYLAWPVHLAPALPAWLMLKESTHEAQFGQWLFRRDIQANMQLACVVVSAAGRVSGLAREALVDGVINQVVEQLSTYLGRPCPAPAASRLALDPQATFACTAHRPKPDHATLHRIWPGLWLAGDYCWPQYPATLESAVRSGKAAALAAHHHRVAFNTTA
jgi:hydroxysqualene dehydroxylase